MLIALIVCYTLASLVTGVAVLIDKEKPEWTIALALTVGWPIAVPLAAGYQLVKDILEALENRKQERRAVQLRFCSVIHKMELISSCLYSQILRGPL